MNVSTLLTDEAKQVLTEQSLLAIETALAEKIELTVEAALVQQDELYAEKLQQLVRAIDKDHTTKLSRVVEAIDKNNANKLIKVVKRYERSLTSEATSFKETLVESISDYLEEFINEAIPQVDIVEATKNRTAREVLTNLRKVLAVDSALMSESIQSAVVDGKNRIDELSQQVSALSNENKLLKENLTKTKSALLLEERVSNLSEKKKEYIKKVLSNKTPKFIEENFDYTLKLFEKKERESINIIKADAYSKRTVKADAPVITESAQKNTQNIINPYLSELKRYK